MNSFNQLAPIILFVYNRPYHTRQTVEALMKNPEAKDSLLYIFSDGPKDDASDDSKQKISDLRAYIHTISGFKDVVIEESTMNKGLANSIISGVSEVMKKHGRAIIVEDDLVTSRFFLRFMNEALSLYEDEKRIFSIGGMTDGIDIPPKYKKDIIVVPRMESCGWASWEDRWSSVEWDLTKYCIWGKHKNKEIAHFCRGGEDLWPMLQMQAQGKIDSWAIRFQYNMLYQNKLCVRPLYSLVTNIGMDGTGVHSGNPGILPTTPLYNKDIYDIKLERNIKEDKRILANYRHYYARPKVPMIIKLKSTVIGVLSLIRKCWLSILKIHKLQ